SRTPSAKARPRRSRPRLRPRSRISVSKESVMRAVFRVSTVCSLAAMVACAPTVQQEVAIGDEYHQQLQQELPIIRDARAVASFREAVAPLRRAAERQ